MKRPRVLILGGSFGGLELLRQLRRLAPASALEIVLIDRASYVPYPPLAHETITQPRRRHAGVCLKRAARRYEAEHLRAEVLAVDEDGRGVTARRLPEEPAHAGAGQRPADEERALEPEPIPADAVVVALGSYLAPPTGFAGAERLLTHKSAAEVARCRRALAESLRERPKIAIIGAGLCGVEMAGGLACAVHDEDPAGRPREVTLVAGPRGVLPTMPPSTRRGALRALDEHGVTVAVGPRATRVEEGRLHLDDGRTVGADLCFWGGGIRPSDPVSQTRTARRKGGFLRVDRALRCLDDGGRPRPGLFAVGDAAMVEDEGEPLLTMHGRLVAPFRQGRVVARNVLAHVDRSAPAARYRPLPGFPSAVSIGRTVLLVSNGITARTGALSTWGRQQLALWWERRYV